MAREAALLLYTSQEKEFKQAKFKAAEALGMRILPSNLEVAVELDRIADEYEGSERLNALIRMRREALKIMKCVRKFSPKLVGSVWRGTVHRGSDIDIKVFSSNPKLVINQLQRNGFKIKRTESISEVKDGNLEESFHIYVSLPSGDEAEVIVRSPEKMAEKEICEIYGDEIKGLSLDQLENVIKEDPIRRFLPSRAISYSG